MTQSVKIFFG
jgi:hypothetical protein